MKGSARRRVCWIAAACLALAGCDGVGRALVEAGGGGNFGDLTCEPIECRDILFAPLQFPAPQAPDLTRCTARSPALCEPASETEPGLDRDPPGACRRTFSLDDDTFDPDALRTLSCTKARFVRTQSGSDAVLRIEGANWAQLELDIETADPVTLELVSPQLTNLQMRVHGPVTLRVLDTQAVNDWMVATDSPAATVDLRDTQVKAVRFGDPQLPFAGKLSIARSTIAQASIDARDLALETVGLNDSRITAVHMEWVDVTSRRTKLSAGTAVISASRLSEMEIEQCELLSFHRSSLASYAIPSCTGGPTRLFESTLSRGSLQGAFDIDGSRIDETVFGMHDATDLLLWATSLSRVNFCAGTDHVVVAGQGSFLCATCRELDGTGVPIDACVHEENKTSFLKSCGVLAVAPVCEPTPLRMRPPFN
jgi:hypothetical protein